MSDPSPPELLAFIKRTFDWEELKTLCFQLYVPFDDLAGETREAKARELIGYMQRQGRLPDLAAELARERPDQFTASFSERRPAPTVPVPPARDPNQIFISHAHQDSEFAHRLADDLRRHQFAIWIAPESIPPGERWVDAINRALRQSGVFLLVSTPRAVNSVWVQDETSYAIDLAAKGQIRFLRLDVEEADAPPFWTIRQHISFQHDYHAGLDELLNALGSAVEQKPLGAGPPQDSLAAKAQTPAPETTGSEPPETIEKGRWSRLVSRRPADVPKVVWRVAPAWLLGAAALVTLLVAVRPISNLIRGPTINPAELGVGDTLATLAALQTSTGTANSSSQETPPAGEPTVSLQNAEVRTMPLPGGSEIELVRVPGGRFTMGSVEVGADERPTHVVALDSFWLSRYEVTNSQFAAFVAYTGHSTTAEQQGGGYNFTGDERVFVEGADWRHPQGSESGIDGLHLHPVVLVSWDDAAAYCEWIGGRLPTEAEWEYAARGPDARMFPWGDVFDGGRLNYCDRSCPFDQADGSVDDGYEYTSPAGFFADGVSWSGALDMAGNVWEWVNDWYGETYYSVSAQENPQGPAVGEHKVLRGGAWDSLPADTRSALRISDVPYARYYHVGFRCALD